MAEKKTTKQTAKQTTKQKRPVHSGFDAPEIFVIDNTPPKYLPNGNINPAWTKRNKKK